MWWASPGRLSVLVKTRFRMMSRSGPLKLVAVGLVARFGLGVVVLHGVLPVGGHHAVEGEARRLLPDLYLRVALHQFLAESRHADYAAPRERCDGQHIASLLEHIGEIVVHIAGDELMLLPSQLGELRHTRHKFLFRLHEPAVERLALGGELAALMGGAEQRVELVVEAVAPVVARAVAGIMADVERLVALGRLGERVGHHGVGVVGAESFLRVGFQLAERVGALCACSECGEGE